MSRRAFQRRTILILTALLLPFGAQAAGRCERLIATGAADYPPYVWRDPAHPDRLTGAAVELLGQLGKAIGVDIRMLHNGDAARAEEEVRTGRADLLIATRLTPARLDTMDFVHPAFLVADELVWVRKDAVFPYAGWEDLRGRRGVVLENDATTAGIAREQLTLETAPNLTQALQSLLLRRVDYGLYERYPGLATAETLGMQNDVQALEPAVASEGLYVALAHDSACNEPWLRGQLAKKMTELVAAGIPQRLLEENLARWKAQQLQPASIPTQ